MTEETKAPKAEKETKAPKAEVKVFTYVGAGEDSPNVIKFMGKVDMVRGEPVEIPVTDEYSRILSKIEGCQTIVEGVVERKSLQETDIKAKEKADKQRLEDKKTNEKAIKALGKTK